MPSECLPETTLDRLPEEMLEAVLLKIPYRALVHGKRVCKKWKRILESEHYKQFYRGTVKLVRKHDGRRLSVEIIDSNNDVLRPGRSGRIVFGSIKSPKTSLLSARWSESENEDKLYICNIFINKWKEIPEPDRCGYDDFVAIFCLEGVGCNLVYWNCYNKIMTLVLGHPQLGWSTVREPDTDSSSSRPVVINDRMFCLDVEKEMLLEYSVLGDGHFSSIPLAFMGKDTFEFADNGNSGLVAWEDELYMLCMDEAKEPQRVQVWWISTGDGRTTLMSEFETEHRIDFLRYITVEADNTHILICNWSRTDASQAVHILYNMRTHSVAGTSLEPGTSQSAILPVSLTQAPE